VADRYRRNRVMGWTLVSWTALISLSATAVNYVNLLLARAVMGIGQSVDDPASTSLLGDYYPPRMRSRVFSIQQIAVFVGSGIGLGLGGFVGSTFGWRWAFALVGIPGSAVAFLVFRMREPRRGEAEMIEGGLSIDTAVVEEAPPPPLREVSVWSFLRQAMRDLTAELKMIFRIRTMRYILVGVSAILFTVSGIVFWLAVYHDRHSGMTLKEATAFTAAVLAIAGAIGTILGGWMADRIFTRGPNARIVFVVQSMIVCGALFLISFNVPNVPLRLALQFVGVIAAAGSIPGLRASMLDVVPAESRGVGTSAFALCSAMFGTALAPPLVGRISDATGSLSMAFHITFPPIMFGMLFLLRARHTIVEDAQAIITAMMERAEADRAEDEAALTSGD